MFGASITASGTLTQINQTFPLNLTYTDFPHQVEIIAFAVDGNGNRGEARQDTSLASPIKRDTVTVVNGITKPLPAGGRVADGIYNRNQNELYLTNVDRNRLEVFRIADTSYVAGGIPVGSRPWGIALWPRDTLGNNADSVVVANSGGTNLSIVDVSPAARRETRRHRLPSFLVQFVSTEINPENQTIQLKIEEYDFADRPQFLGMVCRPNAGATACAADSVIAVYSTAPTPGQTGEFVNRGTMRWENLTAGTASSHFFYEHASVAPSPDFDSLQVLIDHPLTGIDTLLHVAKGIVVDREQLVFQDTTFVRNSGNFTHTLIGEGDIAQLGRAIGYNGNAFLEQSVDCTDIQGTTLCGSSQRDNGITGTARVRDFVANTATRVKSIAVNFNGLTNVIRADDSVYVLDERLFLGGIIPVGGANAGMDLNFQHAFDPFIGGTPGTFGGNADPNLRMIFLARPDANIDVFDTFRFERVTTIPIRDPIIGPLRVALLPSGDQILVGVTARGVVTVRFPQITNIFPMVDDGPLDLNP
jgi:hypothetical protein